MLRFVFSLCAFLALLFALPTSAYADEAAARAHFKKGIELYDKKQYADALGSFEAAYREKPSAGIKQNIALCLKGLNQPAEAATSFDDALAEGKDTLKPETKSAIEHELADLTKTVATVVITIAGADDKTTAQTVITIAPVGQAARTLPAGAQRRPIRLLPGIYTFSAKIPGQPAPEPKRLAVVSGPPTEVTFAQQFGNLTVKANVPDAAIIIDGAQIAKGTWTGSVPAGKHAIEVSATGWRTFTFDITVPAGAAVESPVTLQPAGSAPGEYVAPSTPGGRSSTGFSAKAARIYLAVTASIEGVSYRVGPAFAEPKVRHGFAGGSLGGRFGFVAAKGLALELMAEAGVATSRDTVPPATDPSVTTVTHWQAIPAIRFSSSGKVRFTVGTGFGVHGLIAEKKPESSTALAALATYKGSGISTAWILDTGAMFDVGPLFIETILFLNVHGVGAVKEDVTGGRVFEASPATRAGLRVGLGIPF